MSTRPRKINDTPEFRQMWADGLTLGRLAAMHGVSPAAIRQAAEKFGLPPRRESTLKARIERSNGWAPEEDANLRMLRANQLSQAACAVVLGRSRAAVAKRCATLGLTTPQDALKEHLGQQLRAAEAAAEVPDTSLAGRLRATKGSYAALAEIAAAEGWTHAQAQQRWHRARVEA